MPRVTKGKCRWLWEGLVQSQVLFCLPSGHFLLTYLYLFIHASAVDCHPLSECPQEPPSSVPILPAFQNFSGYIACSLENHSKALDGQPPFLFSSCIHTLLDFFQVGEFFISRDEETEVGCFGGLALPPSRGLNSVGWPERPCREVWHFWVWGGFRSPTLSDSNWAELESVWESHKVLPKLNKLATSIPSQIFWIV